MIVAILIVVFPALLFAEGYPSPEGTRGPNAGDRPLTSSYTGFNDLFHYNRVEGAALGLGLRTQNLLPDLDLLTKVSYGFADRRWRYRGEAMRWRNPSGSGQGRRLAVGAGVYREIRYEEDPALIKTVTITKDALLSKKDHRNYYTAEGKEGFVTRAFSRAFTVRAGSRREHLQSDSTQAKFSLFKRGERFRPTPSIREGWFSGVYLKGTCDTRIKRRAKRRSNGWTAEGIVEHTDRRLLKSDFSYTCLQGKAIRYQTTTPSAWLSAEVRGGMSIRPLPPHRMFDVGGGPGFYFPFGVLRGVPLNWFQGDRFATVLIDYHFGGRIFKDVPFPRVSLADMFEVIGFAGAAWTSLSARSRAMATDESLRTTDGIYTEVGLSVAERRDYFRFDVMFQRGDRRPGRVSVRVSANY